MVSLRRVGLHLDVLRSEVIIAVVAHDGGDALAFRFEAIEGEEVASVKQTLFVAPLDGGIAPILHATKADGVDHVRLAQGDEVSHPGFERILVVGDDLIAGRAAEETVFVEYVLRCQRPVGRLYGVERHRPRREPSVHPLVEAPLFLDVGIIDPEPDRQRRACGGTA